MIAITIQCPCGQKFAFDVEPVNGRMPVSVACPACGADGTNAANEQIQLQTVGSRASSVAQKKSSNLTILTLCAALGIVIGAAGGGLFWLKNQKVETIPQVIETQTVQSTKTPTPSPVAEKSPEPTGAVAESVQTATAPKIAETKPPLQPVANASKTQRDPSFVPVGAFIDRDLKTRNVEITKVTPSSPAADAGIRAGFILTKIDDAPLGELRLKEVAELLYGPVGSKVALEVVDLKTLETNRVEIIRKVIARK
jgi:hypothetical protein